ncbi:uncharacterized protein LOC133486382 [Phyllopteryx taeniolatus]|uniref:uncharacterized protein LOC133486382 n=1 Tax=Phyllopteryx taeniolatus TaxID=161469 RepID=UPI002AD376AD|nr:uncharacterized protein LOC133486382 [Phyllopteryx taeniolatus]XP_061647398.1 uncharacterized protein LOC133486382 [Phyllopteryx taeniolatus]XP_061647399.1 uncharacterized protein LOC133486382 [Phyllopteryx taeniolatus]
MGKYGFHERNLEGQMVVDFAKRMQMAVVNTFFSPQRGRNIGLTYKTRDRSTQVDYILCRRCYLKEVTDCKVVVGESVARQHRMVVCKMTLVAGRKMRKTKAEQRTMWWKLRGRVLCSFSGRGETGSRWTGGASRRLDHCSQGDQRGRQGRVLGVSSGRKGERETWWWNLTVQEIIQGKRLAKKKWNTERTEERRKEYIEMRHRAKVEVAKAKQEAYDDMYARLDTKEGEKDLYGLARQRDRDGKDVQHVRVVKDRDGNMLTGASSVLDRWKEYFKELMNEETERSVVDQEVAMISKGEVRKASKRMKNGKAVGPDDIPVEVWKHLGEVAVEFLTSLFNRILAREKMPEEWRKSKKVHF